MGLLAGIDPRNDPIGYPASEPPQRYRIREVVRPRPFGARYQLRGSGDPPSSRLPKVHRRLRPHAMDPVSYTHLTLPTILRV